MGIVENQLGKRRVLEGGLYSKRLQLLDNVEVGGPVLQPLKIPVKTLPHVGMALKHDRMSALPGSGERRRKSGGPGPNNLYCRCHRLSSPHRGTPQTSGSPLQHNLAGPPPPWIRYAFLSG
jgi:hypothetical protein